VCYLGNKRRSFLIFCKLSVLSFELATTLSLYWSCKIPFTDSTYFELKVLIAEFVTLDSNEKCVECRSKEQRRAFPNNESFELAATLSWLWFCKIPFSHSTYLKWKVLITAYVTLETNEDRFKYFVSWVCYLSKWLRRYHDTDPAKYHFQIQLISNWKFW